VVHLVDDNERRSASPAIETVSQCLDHCDLDRRTALGKSWRDHAVDDAEPFKSGDDLLDELSAVDNDEHAPARGDMSADDITNDYCLSGARREHVQDVRGTVQELATDRRNALFLVVTEYDRSRNFA